MKTLLDTIRAFVLKVLDVLASGSRAEATVLAIPVTAPAAPSHAAPAIPTIALSAPATTPISHPSAPQVPLLALFCYEIQNMEGWTPGSTSFTHNNPGNIRCTPGNMANWNALSNGERGGFCTFVSAAVGMQALQNVTVSCAKGLSPTYNAAAHKLGLANSGELNLFQYFETRDPPADGNQPDLLAVRFGKVLGVDPATFRMKQLLS